MPSTQVTGSGVVEIPNVTGRIVATMMSAPATAWITADGSVPVPTAPGVIVENSQTALAGVVGAQAVIYPIQPGTGGRSYLPLVQVVSSGSPVIQLEW